MSIFFLGGNDLCTMDIDNLDKELVNIEKYLDLYLSKLRSTEWKNFYLLGPPRISAVKTRDVLGKKVNLRGEEAVTCEKAWAGEKKWFQLPPVSNMCPNLEKSFFQKNKLKVLMAEKKIVFHSKSLSVE